METSAATPADNPKPAKLRWYQYSLRTLLIFVTLCALLCSWVTVRMERARKQKEAVEAIRKVGRLYVAYDYQMASQSSKLPPPGPAWLRKVLGDDFFTNANTVWFPSEGVTDADLEHLNGLTQLEYLCLAHTQVTDAGLKHITGLSQLESVELDYTKVTDAGLKYLKALGGLQKLNLAHTQATGAGLEHLQGLNKLHELDLRCTPVTDAGLEHLRGLSQLQVLSLDFTEVTDAGLEHLKGLKRLQRLGLVSTRVTVDGVRKLQRALPNCSIEHGPATQSLLPRCRPQPPGLDKGLGSESNAPRAAGIVVAHKL